MPLAKRIVRPRKLARVTLDKEERFDLASVCNYSLVSTLKQLSNLAGHADQLFSELTDEFTTTARRANKLRERVHSLADTVSKLNAKAVQIPQGNLETYAKIATHYHGENSYKGNLFTPETQPECIRNVYNEADDSPVSVIGQCNSKRTDGLTGSQLFTLTPFFKDGPYKQSEVDFEIKPVAAPPIGPKPTEKSEVKDKDQSASQTVDVTPDSNPCPDGGEAEARAADSDKSPPADLVPIDVTGATFNRMCEYRESIRSSSREYVKDGTVKQKKRRQTVSGAPGMVFSEISTSLFNMNQLSSHVSMRTRSVSYERPKSAALESYAPRTGSKSELKKIKERERKKAKHDPDESNLARSCSLRRSLKSIFKDKRSKSTDLWAEGRPRSPGPPVVDLAYPMKRSRSLPRSLKSAARGATSASDFDRERSASTEGRLDAGTDERAAGGKAGRPPKAHHHQQKAAKSRNRIPRSVSHNTTLSGSTFVDHAARPKSMEVGPQAFSSPTTPSNDSLASSVTQDSHISIGKHIHINIPDKPWTKPFARVKLRFRRKQKRETKDDRQSSSGHWSASSSSARHSLDSDCRRSASSPDRLSLCDRDSAVSLNIHGSERCPGKISEETSTYGDGDSSTLNGSSSENESIVDMKNNFSKGKTHDWLKTVTGKKGKDTSSSSGKVKTIVGSDLKTKSNKTMPESCLTTQNLKAHDSVHQPLNKGFSRVGDDESSIYSVDQEGFYTSMHKDCGLTKGIEDLLEEEEEDNLSSSTISGNNTNTTMSGHSSISRKFSSFISRKGTVKRKDSDKSKPPPPPRRSSMIADKTKAVSKPPAGEESPPKTELQKLAELAQRIAAQKEQEKKQSERSPSCESDAESIFARVQSKSVISPSVIPSLCSVTPIATDEEDSDFVGLSKTWRRQSSQDATKYIGYLESLKNVKSAPGTLDSSTLTESSFSSTSLDMSSVKGDISTVTEDSSGHYSTWPRSPTSKHDGARRAKLGAELLKPPECLTIRSPKPNLFYADEKFSFVDSRHPLPEAKTPDSVLEDRVFVSPTNNTFRAPQETSTPAGYEKGQLGRLGSQPVNSQPPAEESLDSSQSSKKSAEWMSTWPRRKGVKFVSSAQSLSKDDSVLSTGSGPTPKAGIMKKNSFSSFPRKGDHAHFININSSQSNPPDSLPLSSPSPQQLQAAHAKLVISSPVSNRASFVENPYKRSVCSPVTANDLLKFWNYTSTDNWYNTLPRSARQDVKPSFSFSNAHDLQEIRHDRESGGKPVINKVPGSVNEADFPGPSALDEDPASSKRPPSKPLFPSISAMKHAVEFPGAPKKKAEPTNYGRTWYDGIDTLSTVVVMSPDGTQTLRGPQSAFSAFIKDQGTTTLGVPGIVRHRRDSTTSSISTNSSSSGRKSVTFATIHKTSSSSLSRTSLDASSITSSQMSGDIPTDRRSVQSTASDDGIQVTPQKRDILSVFQPRDPPVLLSTCLKRSSSNGSSELRTNPPLETIIGSDSETPHNLSEDQSFDETTLCACETSPNSAETATGNVEPSVKRQKVNDVTVTRLSPKHRTGARNTKANNIVVSTSFVGPSVKVDHPVVAKVFCENGNEIKPMPLITTSFVGAFKMDSGNEKSAECTLKHKGLFTNKTADEKSDGSQETNATERSAPSAEPYKTVGVGHLSGQGCSKHDADTKACVGSKSLSVSQPRLMSQISVKSKQDPEDSAGSPSNIVAVRMNTSGSLPRQASAPNKLSSFSPEQLKTSTESASSTDMTKPVTSPLSTSCVSSSSSSSSTSSPSVESSSVLLLPSSTSTATTSSITTRTALTTSSSSSPSSSSAMSRPGTLQTKPTTAKFVLPKLRPWNPPNLSNSRTSTLLSQLSAVATQGASLDAKPEAGDGQDKGASDESGGQRTGSSHKEDGHRSPGAAVTPKTNSSAKDGHPAVCDRDDGQPRSGASSSACNSPKIDSLKSSHLSRSSGSLNRWSTADIGSSALSLARSTSSLAGLGLSSTSLNRSCLSLAKSTESLASNSSTADRSRAAKLAFFSSGLEDGGSSTKTTVDQRFASHAGAQSRPGRGDKPQQVIAKSGQSKAAVRATDVPSKVSSSTRASSLKFGLKNSASKSSPVQGKFVNSILGKLHKKGINTSLTRTSQKATAQK